RTTCLPELIVTFKAEKSPLPLLPELGQNELQQRKLPRLITYVVEDAVDQTILKHQANLACRAHDCGSQLLFIHSVQIHQRAVQTGPQSGLGKSAGQEVRPQRTNHGQRLDQDHSGNLVDELLTDLFDLAEGVQILPLIENQ